MKPINTAYLLGKRNLVSIRWEFWGTKWNWGKNAIGWIAYDREGKMSVEIKAEKTILPYVANLFFGNLLAYGGTYSVKGNHVIHHLEYGSQKAWVGKDQVREILQLDEKFLVLQAGKSVKYTLVWMKE